MITAVIERYSRIYDLQPFVSMNKAQAISLAQQYRLERDLNGPECSDYVVVIRKGQIIGYNRQRRPASANWYRDINVDSNDNVFIALGHSLEHWAQYWAPLA